MIAINISPKDFKAAVDKRIYPDNKKWFILHNKIKYMIFLPALRIIDKWFNKTIIKDSSDIVPEWYNNHIRMWLSSWERGINHYWYYQHYNLYADKKKESRKMFLGRMKKSYQHNYRLIIPRIWATEMIYDTADREWFNNSILFLTRDMMKHYGVSPDEIAKIPVPGDYPAYNSLYNNNPSYFLNGLVQKVYVPPDDEVYE